MFVLMIPLFRNTEIREQVDRHSPSDREKEVEVVRSHMPKEMIARDPKSYSGDHELGVETSVGNKLVGTNVKIAGKEGGKPKIVQNGELIKRPTSSIGWQPAEKDLVAVQGRLESLIALRDYDFVGEDQRLMGLLGERMELLRRTVDLADIEASIAKENTLNLPDIPPDFVPKPDLLQINLQSFPKFNVSMDYGEILNANMEVDPSLSHPDGELTFNITEPEAGRRTGNLTASRRAPVYWDPSFWHYDLKLVDLMKQNIYMVQDRFLEIQSTVEKYQSDDRFKIAYIFNRLDEWKKDIRTAFHAMSKPRHWTVKMHVRQQLLYYEHLLRKNIDITYSIEFLNHLHGSFMVKMKELIPGRGTKGKMLLKQQKDDIKAHQNAQGK